MEGQKVNIRNKGGRPKKAEKKDQLITLKCSVQERKAIASNAQAVNLTVSEYLRKMGLTGKIDRREKTIPKEVLQLTGTINHLAANLNQIAKKRNGFDELNALERATLKVQSDDLKRIAIIIKEYYK